MNWDWEKLRENQQKFEHKKEGGGPGMPKPPQVDEFLEKFKDTLAVENISCKTQAVSKCPVLTKMVQPSTLKGLCALMCGLRNQVPLG